VFGITTSGDLARKGDVDIPSQAEAAKSPDNPPTHIDGSLESRHSVMSGLLERMMRVMECFPKRGKREPEEVGRQTTGLVRTATEHVADRVDAEGRVKREKGCCASPECCPNGSIESSERVSHPKGQKESDDDDDIPKTVNPDDEWIVSKTGSKPRIDGFPLEHPAHVGVPKTTNDVFETGSVCVGRMWIERAFDLRVVCSMSTCPVNAGALNGGCSEDKQTPFYGSFALEALVGEHSVVADGDAESWQDVADGEDDEIESADSAVERSTDDRQKWADNPNRDGDFMFPPIGRFRCQHEQNAKRDTQQNDRPEQRLSPHDQNSFRLATRCLLPDQSVLHP